MTTRRKFLKTAGSRRCRLRLAAPAVVKAQSAITWRMQTYAGAALAEHVTKPVIKTTSTPDSNGELQDRTVLCGSACAHWRTVPSASARHHRRRCSRTTTPWPRPTEAAPVRRLLPLRHASTSLDVPVLFNQYGLKEIWDEEYNKVGVKWISAAGAGIRATLTPPRKSPRLADLEGPAPLHLPNRGSLPVQIRRRAGVDALWEDAEVAVQTGELDGMAWSGITEDYTVGWADVTNYFLTNNISGAWIGSWFINQQRWADLPDHLKSVVMAATEAGHIIIASGGIGVVRRQSAGQRRPRCS